MIKSGFIIDTGRFEIIRDCQYDDKRIEGMFYRVDDKDIIPIAYVYPIEHKNKLKLTAKEAKIRYDKIINDIYYKELPKVRE